MDADGFARKRRWRVQARFIVNRWLSGPCSDCQVEFEFLTYYQTADYPDKRDLRRLAHDGVKADLLIDALGCAVPVCVRCMDRRRLMQAKRGVCGVIA